MSFEAKVLADSIAPSGVRLTTMQWTFPRIILAEFNTHRMLSRNAASSRAIPVEKMIQRVQEDPFIPVHWGKNQKGMQAEQELTDSQKFVARNEWLGMRDEAINGAKALLAIGLHKQIANRLLEPWMWTTVIVSATTWSNLWGLRCHKDAEPHFQIVANMAKAAFDVSTPIQLKIGQWHRPLFDSDNRSDAFENDYLGVEKIAGETASTFNIVANKISVGRCARVSYLTHDGRRDLQADIELHDRLAKGNPGHWSPFEHVARVEIDPNLRSGNFTGWTQYRKLFEQEHIGGVMP